MKKLTLPPKLNFYVTYKESIFRDLKPSKNVSQTYDKQPKKFPRLRKGQWLQPFQKTFVFYKIKL